MNMPRDRGSTDELRDDVDVRIADDLGPVVSAEGVAGDVVHRGSLQRAAAHGGHFQTEAEFQRDPEEKQEFKELEGLG